MSRDFTYIDDIVEGVIRVIDNPAQPNSEWNGQTPDPATSTAPYKVYNIGNNNPVQLMDFIKAIENALGVEAEKQMLPLQAGDVETTYADVSNLVRDFDYQPKTTVQEGINQFVEWYKQYYHVGKSVVS
jgi:UDP-glucuronate 4-epimerase